MACSEALRALQRAGKVVSARALEDKQREARPPDAEALGLDLGALTQVRAADSAQAARAAGLLMRSGALGALALDLGAPGAVSAGAWARLRSWAERHQTALIVLTPPGARLDALVSWRARCARVASAPGERAVVMQVVRDKRGGPGARVEVTRAPIQAYA